MTGRRTMNTVAVCVVFLALITFSGCSFESAYLAKVEASLNYVKQLLTAQTVQVLTASAYDPSEMWRILQDKIPKETKFPCHYSKDKPTWRSRRAPTSVHKLRPGDIDVVIVMGDSLSAGAAIREPTPLGFFTDHRGVSFVGGGEKTWREYTTLPNILKEFNPEIYGYATGNGPFFSDSAHLNVAISGSTDVGLLAQAQYLLNITLEDPKVNMDEDWKVISILIGQNNICSYYCSDPVGNSPDAHKNRLQEVLDFIQDNFPRTFVNLISVIGPKSEESLYFKDLIDFSDNYHLCFLVHDHHYDPTITARSPGSRACEILRPYLCRCLLTTPDLQDNIAQISAVVRQYQEKEKELASDPRYQDKDDFAVVLQPFFMAVNAPSTRGAPEVRAFSKFFNRKLPIFAAECFHLNQRGSALVARTLWNNMLEPVGNKTMTLEDIYFQGIKCPTKSNPYLFTGKNSENYYKHCHQ